MSAKRIRLSDSQNKKKYFKKKVEGTKSSSVKEEIG